ncbi:heme peroxidase [Rhizoctonia solani]|uniref:Heme peroxidase n=1 Tax=Rhizoctonia solani TaxID=456999 RepID=A0A8H7LX67_9AGAM|nr:heme peroxidase [Rhizoctonia solani]
MSSNQVENQPAATPNSGEQTVDKRFCQVCQHCQHNENPLPQNEFQKVEALLVQAASGAIQVDDRPKSENKENPADYPFLSRAFAALAMASVVAPKLVNGLNNHAIRLLYETLPHPVETYIGERFRSADGSGNNIYAPSMGQAGSTYARTCQGRHVHKDLPKAEDVFNALLKSDRPEKEREDHPGGNSSLTFAFASLVTHSLFRTDPSEWNKNLTSSYLDLSPLYGSNQKEQETIRVKDGRGLLHPDTFAEGRIVFLPPAAAALLVVWNRNHNHIAEKILAENERGKWKNPPSENISARMAQEEEIFQTARLINCASFMSVVMNDYVAGFLGLAKKGVSWNMDPFQPFRDTNHRPVGRGEGNHVSVEFNLLYRWHTVVSNKEEEWTTELLGKIFKDKHPRDLELSDFYEGLGRLRTGDIDPSLIVDPDPRKRNFGGIKRGEDGRFHDRDLARVLQNGTRHSACRYGARGTPTALKVMEIMGIQQARSWGVCTMNEFRERLGLKPFGSFKEWNSNDEIAGAAEKLYKNINNLELYPGLHAEEAMKPMHSGLCAGYTMTRAILADAIALVRGDRFFTTDFTPSNLTQWAGTTWDTDASGPVLMRAFPEHYPDDSIYTLFPFFTPKTTKESLKEIEAKIHKKFDYKKKRPTKDDGDSDEETEE